MVSASQINDLWKVSKAIEESSRFFEVTNKFEASYRWVRKEVVRLSKVQGWSDLPEVHLWLDDIIRQQEKFDAWKKDLLDRRIPNLENARKSLKEKTREVNELKWKIELFSPGPDFDAIQFKRPPKVPVVIDKRIL